MGVFRSHKNIYKKLFNSPGGQYWFRQNYVPDGIPVFSPDDPDVRHFKEISYTAAFGATKTRGQARSVTEALIDACDAAVDGVIRTTNQYLTQATPAMLWLAARVAIAEVIIPMMVPAGRGIFKRDDAIGVWTGSFLESITPYVDAFSDGSIVHGTVGISITDSLRRERSTTLAGKVPGVSRILPGSFWGGPVSDYAPALIEKIANSMSVVEGVTQRTTDVILDQIKAVLEPLTRGTVTASSMFNGKNATKWESVITAGNARARSVIESAATARIAAAKRYQQVKNAKRRAARAKEAAENFRAAQRRKGGGGK